MLSNEELYGRLPRKKSKHRRAHRGDETLSAKSARIIQERSPLRDTEVAFVREMFNDFLADATVAISRDADTIQGLVEGFLRE